MNNKQLVSILATWALSACTPPDAPPDPISETGFHEDLPGAFNYFKNNDRPCGSIGSNGNKCINVYDDQNRMVHQDCEGQYISDFAYSEDPIENTVTRTEVIQGYEAGRDQTNVEIYTLLNGVAIAKHSTMHPESQPLTSTTYDYVRDSTSRLEVLNARSGFAKGSTQFVYDEQTGLLTKSTFTGDLFPTFEAYDAEYDWKDGLLAEVRWTSHFSELSGVVRYFYDEFGAAVLTEKIENGTSVTWSDDPSCDDGA